MLNKPSFEYEHQYSGIVAGVDEAGCGAWAGPVIAAAAFITSDCPLDLLTQLDDSKRLSTHKRNSIYDYLMKNPTFILYGIGEGNIKDIRDLNVRGATHKAMKEAIHQLTKKNSYPLSMILVDGIGRLSFDCPTISIPKGDQLSYSIAAASIIAKVTRDRHMVNLASNLPHYGWHKNMGYGTALHQQALARHGPSPHHRDTFKPIVAYAAMHDELLFSSGWERHNF